VVNTTGGALDNYPIAISSINLNRWIQARRLDEHAWDLLPVDSGINETWGMAQETGTDANKTLWFYGDIISGGSTTTTFGLFTGSGNHQRDQGMYFYNASGADTLTVADHADFDETDDFAVVIRARTDSPDQSGILVDKFNAFSGFEILVTTTGDGTIEGAVGNTGTGTRETVSAVWDGDETIRLRFDNDGAGDDLFLDYLDTDGVTWVNQDSTATTFTSVSANAIAMIFGNNYDGIISDAYYLSGISGSGNSGTVAAKWGFEPQDMTETQVGTSGNGWTYLGAVADEIGAHDGSYSLVNSQTQLAVSLSPTRLTFGQGVDALDIDSPDQIGSLGGSDFSTDPNDPRYEELGDVGDALAAAIESTSLTVSAFKMLLVLILIGVLGWLIMKFTPESEMQNTMVMLMAVFVSISAAVIHFLTPAWYAAIPAITAVLLWLLLRRMTA
jgi:hypothetical protein